MKNDEVMMHLGIMRDFLFMVFFIAVVWVSFFL